MAQTNTAPALDKDVKELHQHLVDVLGGERADETPGKPYWDTSSTTFQDDFRARVAEQLKTYADQSAGSQGGDSQSAAKQAGG
jgi:hypothetical protein